MKDIKNFILSDNNAVFEKSHLSNIEYLFGVLFLAVIFVSVTI